MSFLILYFPIYGAMNALVFDVLRRALPSGWRWRLPLACIVAAQVFAPFVARWLDRQHFDRLSALTTFIAWHWMAFALWTCCLGGLLIVWNLLAGLRRPAVPPAEGAASAPCGPGWAIPEKRGVAVVLLLVGLLFLWGTWEARQVRVEHVRLEIPAERGLRAPLRVMLFTDVHLSRIRHRLLPREILRIAEAERPDLLLSGGDFADGLATGLLPSAALLRGIHAPLGNYAILGNHEWYAGLENALPMHEAAGLRLLRGEAVRLRDDVVLAGADDSAGRRRGPLVYHGAEELPASLNRLLNASATEPLATTATQPTAAAARPFVLFLYHQPTVPMAMEGQFDLMLSGHTHGGQIMPFGLVVMRALKYFKGLYTLPDGARLYVCRGTGTWGPSLRVMAPPEVTILDLVPAGVPAAIQMQTEVNPAPPMIKKS